MKFLARILTDQSGASAAEYAMILAIVGAGIVFAAISLGDAIGGAINDTATCLSTASAGSAVC